MNKRKIRIVGWALGLSMAMVGAGVATAVSNAERSPIATLAAEQTYYTLACTKPETNNSGYANTYNVSITSGTITHTWSAPGNQTLGDYWRIGGKGGSQNESVSTFDREIKGTSAFSEAISSITVYHNGTSNANAVVNSVTLTVASNAAFSSDVAEVELTPTIEKSKSGNFSFNPSEATEWPTNRYYKFTFNITCTGKSNYGIDLTSIVFKHDVVSDDYATNLSASSNSISPSKGSLVNDALGELTITAQVNGAAAAAYSNYSATITRRDDNVDEVSDATVFKVGDKKITLTANDPTTQGGSTYDTFEISTNVSFTSVVNVGSKYALVSDSNVFTCAVSSNLGQYASYTNTPSAYALAVENGAHPGTYALKIVSGANANKYVAFTGSTSQLGISDTKDIYSSWVIFNNGENDVIACASQENATLRFNSNRFCVYAGTTGDAPSFLLLGTPNTDTFNADYMKMSSYDPDKDNTGATNACYGTNGSDGYYAAAKTYYNTSLSNAERALICDEYGLYADAYARLQNWATACGDSIDSSDNYILKAGVASTTMTRMTASNGSLPIIIAIVSGSLLATSGFFLIQRKHKKKD